MQISGTTRVTGLFGYPVRHTFSPAMHNAAFERGNLDYVYLPFEVRPEDLAQAVAALRPLGLAGVNVTIPHKEAVLPLLDEVSEEAALMGSVNTIQVRDTGLRGYNTDAYGFETSLREEAGMALAGKRIFVMGAGGAARAVAFQSALAGAAQVVIADVVTARADALCASVTDRFPNCRVAACPADTGAVEQAVGEKDLFVNATPVGMKAEDPRLIDVAWLAPGAVVFDAIYNPQQTRLLKEATARGLQAVNGIGMLVHQGARAFEIFAGTPAPVETMRGVLQERFGA